MKIIIGIMLLPHDLGQLLKFLSMVLSWPQYYICYPTYYDNTTEFSYYWSNTQNYDNPEYGKGFISNLRVVKGTALYTDDFIPPTRELKKVPGTVLLCCQDPDNPLTEATGKTITGYGRFARSNYVELVTNGNFADSDWTNWYWVVSRWSSPAVF